MTKFNKKMITAVATVALVMGVAAPAAFADTDINVWRNGAFSDNKVKVKKSRSVQIKQSNRTSVVTEINAVGNTGHNSSSFNTGGSSSIDTGDATNSVGVVVHGSNNTAQVENCGQCDSDTTVNVGKNGAFSDNEVKVKHRNWFSVWQSNFSEIMTGISVKSKTGGNDSNFNTGDDSSVQTGDAESVVGVEVHGSNNTLN